MELDYVPQVLAREKSQKPSIILCPLFFNLTKGSYLCSALFHEIFFSANFQTLNLAEFLLRFMVQQNNYLLVSFLYLKQRKDNLTIAYAKMKDFTNPVNMVYSYEVAQTPQNKRLKGMLMDVRMQLRATVNALRRMVRMRKSISINKHSSDQNFQNFQIKQTKCAN